MELKKTHKYDDILHLSRPVSGKRARMAVCDRAAQFSPFAALTGFDAAIEETGRLTDCRIELDEGGKQLLDAQLHKLLEMIHTRPVAEVTWFRQDERKTGGAYISTTGHVKKIDTYLGQLVFTSGESIPLGEVFSVRIEEKE